MNKVDLYLVFINQDIGNDIIKLPILDSITVNRNPTLDKERSIKNYVDDSTGEDFILRFNRTWKRNSKSQVGNTVYILQNYNMQKILDTRRIK